MAPPRDYRKPRNNEMRDLLLQLPHPVKVIDGAGHLLWQNQAAEKLAEEPAWERSDTTWQGKKAVLLLPPPSVSPPDPQLAQLEAENERLRKHQRQTARRKKQAEGSIEKVVVDVGKREQKLRLALEQAELRVSELEAQLERSLEGSIEASLEGSFETSVEGVKGKRKSKSKTRSKAKSRSKKSIEQSLEGLSAASFEAELIRLEQAQSSLRADLAALQTAETRWKEEKRKLETARRALDDENLELKEENRKLKDEQRHLEELQSGLKTSHRELKDERASLEQSLAELREAHQSLEVEHGKLKQRVDESSQGIAEVEALRATVAQLEEDKRQLEAWIEELEAEKADGGKPPSTSASVAALEAARLEAVEGQQQTAARLAAAEQRVRELSKGLDAAAARTSDLIEQLDNAESLYDELKAEYEALKDSQAGRDPNQAAAAGADELAELRADLAEAKNALVESARRETRLAEKLEGALDLKEQQAKVLALLKDDLNELRARERELRQNLSVFENSRDELEQARADARKFREEAEELEERLLESRRELAEARSSGPVARPGGLSLRDVSPVEGGASATVKSQLEFAQSRLRDTEKQLDETREALKKARSEAASAKDTEKLAFQDTLTGLPNRHIVDRYLELSHKQAKSGGRAYSLFLIDIDGFRVLNETFGREWGDALLRSVGERLAGMRGANHIIARHSEDRFLLLAADLAKPGLDKFVEEASRSLLGALAHPFEVKGQPVKLSGSIGVALGPASEDPRELFAQAEVALDSAKAKGVGSYFVHNEALLQKAQRDATYLRQMEHAIERDEFCAVYQPIFNLNKGLVTGMELLLRWSHRDQRTLRPDEFLEVAVRSGQIFAIADNLWPKAFRALARWRRLRSGLTLSLNLSDRELLSPKLAERTLGMLGAAGLDPSAIIFEVRDASRLRMSGTWWTILGALSEAGFGLALDDYGSEASLFGTLAYGGFKQAKVAIDEKSPLCPATPNAAKGVLYCAKRVQTRFDPKGLKKAGFDLAQGFAVGRPIDETDVDGVLAR